MSPVCGKFDWSQVYRSESTIRVNYPRRINDACGRENDMVVLFTLRYLLLTLRGMRIYAVSMVSLAGSNISITWLEGSSQTYSILLLSSKNSDFERSSSFQKGPLVR